MYALREVAAAKSPADQAKAIVEHKIPYRVAATVIRQMTPAVLVALIEQMSSQELINSLGALKRRGALDVPEIKSMVEAKTADRVRSKPKIPVRAATDYIAWQPAIGLELLTP